MRTKLFFAFIVVIIVALISNLIYKNLIVKDFEDYVRGSKEDKLYWILASVEGGYSEGKWDHKSLHEAMHWGMMLGFDLKIIDTNGKEVMGSGDVTSMLAPAMKRRMEGIVDMNSATGEFEPYPLFQEGKEIGVMLVRELSRSGSINMKEAVFMERGKDFLLLSFILAGGSAMFLAVFFSLFLSRPLKKMKQAVEAMAKGDFSVRVPAGSGDEIGRLAESFNFMAEALQREESLRRHLRSNIAHELRTPLAVMKANVEAMIDGVVENQAEGIENIQMEVEKLIRLVEGIEDITKAEASFFRKKDYAKISLHEFLSAVVTKMSPLASEKGLDIKITTSEPIAVLADTDKLERIIQNILANAIKYTETGGIWINYGIEKQHFFIEIRDSGAGIPEDKQRLVFRRFYKGETSKGLGLGLAIVNELADVMGGSIELESKEGEGSVFRILLPMKTY